MRVRGTSGRSASAARRGGRAPAPGTAARSNNSASEKRIKKTLGNSAIAMRYDFAAGLSLLALREILRSCDVGDGPRI